MEDRAAGLIWADKEAYATTLLTLGLDRYGTESLEWHPETWLAEIKEDTGVDLSQRNTDRLLAACALLKRPDEFLNYAPAFNDLTQGLAGEWFSSDISHPPTTAECLWALVESYLLEPPEKEGKPRLSPEVNRYVCMLAAEEGFARLPQSMASFGVVTDSVAFKGIDLSEDLTLNTAAQAGTESREEDLEDDLHYNICELASQIARLPISSGLQQAKKVADELLSKLPRNPRN